MRRTHTLTGQILWFLAGPFCRPLCCSTLRVFPILVGLASRWRQKNLGEEPHRIWPVRVYHLWIPALLVVLCAAPATWAGQWIMSFDTSHLVYPVRRWHFTQVLAGHWPLWNPGLFGGLYQGANPVMALWSPFNVLYLLIDGYLAHQLVIMAHVLLGAVGMAGFVRAWTGSGATALFAAIAYSLGGPFLSCLREYNLHAGASVYPWVLWAYVTGGGLRLALALAWVAFEGDPIGMVTLGLLLAGHRAITFNIVSAVRVLRCLVGAGLLSAIVFVPASDAMESSRRAWRFPYELATYYSLHPARLVEWLVPGFFGEAVDRTFWGQAFTSSMHSPRFWLDSIFPGFLVLSLAAVGAWTLLCTRRLRLLLLAPCGLLLLSFGKFFPLYALFYKLPLADALRFPVKYYSWFALAVVLLSVLGFTELRRPRRLLGACALMAALGAVLAAPFFAHFNPQTALPPFLVQRIWVLGGVAVIYSLYSIRPRHFALGLCVLSACELWVLSSPVPTASRRILNATPDLVSAMTPRQHPHFRLLRDGLLDRFAVDTMGRLSLQPNWPLVDGLRSTFGDDETMPQRMHRLIGDAAFRHFEVIAPRLGIEYVLTPISPPAREPKVLVGAGVLEVVGADEAHNVLLLRTVRSTEAAELKHQIVAAANEEEAWSKTLNISADGDAVVVEGSGAQTSVGDADGARVDIVDVTPGHWRFRTESLAPAFLVVREGFLPGWRAQVDGAAVPVLRADYLNFGVFVPSGSHDVELVFRPVSFFLGLGVTLLAWAFCGAFTWRRGRLRASL